MRKGRRNAHSVIPWFACRQALYSGFQCKHNKHSIEELTSHVKPLPVWLKGKKEGLYLLMIGCRTKLILFSIGRTPLCRFFLSHGRINVSVWPSVWVRGCHGLPRRRSVSPRKVNITYTDVCSHSGFRKHAGTKCTNIHKTLWTLTFYYTSSI